MGLHPEIHEKQSPHNPLSQEIVPVSPAFFFFAIAKPRALVTGAAAPHMWRAVALSAVANALSEDPEVIAVRAHC